MGAESEKVTGTKRKKLNSSTGAVTPFHASDSNPEIYSGKPLVTSVFILS